MSENISNKIVYENFRRKNKIEKKKEQNNENT